MKNVPAVPAPEHPVFIDRLIVQVQDVLKNNLSWLDHSFGQSQRLVKVVDGKDFFYPAVHIRSGNYVSVFPDQGLGNFSFFVVDDPQSVDFRAHAVNNVRLQYSIIFWLNLDKIYGAQVDRNKEAIKAEILKVLTRKVFLTFGRIDVRKIYESTENIFGRYSIKEVDSQYLMQPFCGFRFEGDMLLTEEC